MMYKLKKVLFIIILFLSCTYCVSASCTDEELEVLRKETNKIKITYRHMGPIETEDFIDYNRFEVSIKNINEGFYITYADGTEKIIPGEDGTSIIEIKNGTWIFRVYSNECEEEVSTIKVFLPRFNMYSLDPLCDGIDGDAFALCGKYYEYDVSYDSFKERVTNYRNTHIINDDDKHYDSKDSAIAIILKFVNDYKLYIMSFLCILLIIIIFIIVIRKRKKRSVLE